MENTIEDHNPISEIIKLEKNFAENMVPNTGKVYVDLPDGYRLVFVDGEYFGRYDPNYVE